MDSRLRGNDDVVAAGSGPHRDEDVGTWLSRVDDMGPRLRGDDVPAGE